MSKPTTNFILLHDLVMIFPIARSKTTASGLIIPDAVDKNSTAPIEGIVISVGPGKLDKRDNLIPMPVKIRDRVIFVRNAAKEIKYAGDTFLVVPISEVLCKVDVEHEAS